MIEITKRIYKKSEDKYYEVGDKKDFGKEDNEKIINLGCAKKVIKTRTKKAK